MTRIVPLVLGLSLLTAAALPASARDCKVTGWTGGYGGAPIFDCSGGPSR